MTKSYCILQENEKIRTLLSLIKSNYKSNVNNTLQEVNLEHVSQRISDSEIQKIVKNSWEDLEILVGNEIRLLTNKSKSSLINKLLNTQKELCFILKIKQDPEIFNPAVDMIKKSTNLKIDVKEINI